MRPGGQVTRSSEHFFELLENGRDKEFIAAVTRLYLDGHPMSEVIDGPIRAAMNQIGELWHNNPMASASSNGRRTSVSVRSGTCTR